MSTGPHLDEKTLAALLADPRAHPELLAHLKEPCEACEEFLVAHRGPGLLDGHTDAALLSIKPEAAADDPAGFARLQQAMRPPARKPPRWAYAAVGTLAAAAALMMVVRPPEPPPGAPGVKGSAGEVVELQALWRAPDGALLALGPGAEVPAVGTVLFRARSPHAGPGLMLVQRGAAEPQPLHAALVKSGLEDVRSDEGALGLSLEGEGGPVTVWLVVGDPHTSPTLESARAAVHSATENALAVGRFELHVKP